MKKTERIKSQQKEKLLRNFLRFTSGITLSIELILDLLSTYIIKMGICEVCRLLC
jgi:hypothetical protein